LAADRIPQKDLTVTEPPLLDQLQNQPQTTREVPFSAADYHGADTRLEFVDKPCLYRLRGEFRACHRDVASEPRKYAILFTATILIVAQYE